VRPRGFKQIKRTGKKVCVGRAEKGLALFEFKREDSGQSRVGGVVLKRGEFLDAAKAAELG